MANINKAISIKKNAETGGTVGGKEDMIPFAWRQPLHFDGKKKLSKVVKTMQKEETERSMLMPAPRE